MAKGMTTRSKALEETLSKVSEQLQSHTTSISQFDFVLPTVQQHSDAIAKTSSLCEGIQKSLSAQQTVLADMLQKLARLEKQPATPPLLPTPVSSVPHHIQPFNLQSPSRSHLPSSSHHSSEPASIPNPRLPKLEIPLFSGDNVLGWLFQIEHFFHFHNTPPDQRLDIASFYMSGLALGWFKWMHSTNQLSTWEAFTNALEIRFGPSSF